MRCLHIVFTLVVFFSCSKKTDNPNSALNNQNGDNNCAEDSSEMVLINAGEWRPIQSSSYTCSISYDFYFDRTEVTQASWTAIMGYNPSIFIGDDKPIHNISDYQIIQYCNARSKSEGYDTVYSYSSITDSSCTDLVVHFNRNGYRLPMMYEWEYAYYLGWPSIYMVGQKEINSMVNKYGWYLGNSGGETHQVAQKQPNDMCMYDMLGNIYEVCFEPICKGFSYIDVDPSLVLITVTNQSCSTNIDFYIKGGSFDSYDDDFNVDLSIGNIGNPSYDIGIRCVRLAQ
jgi:formylglycine-generating enzyme required for sulfatase activity